MLTTGVITNPNTRGLMSNADTYSSLIMSCSACRPAGALDSDPGLSHEWFDAVEALHLYW